VTLLFQLNVRVISCIDNSSAGQHRLTSSKPAIITSVMLTHPVRKASKLMILRVIQ